MKEPPVSYLLSADQTRTAITMVTPAIDAAKMTRLKRDHLHIVVMNPVTRPSDVEDPHDAILYELSFGDKEAWIHPYDEIARAKAFASWRTGLPTHVIRETMPYLLQANEDLSDTIYWGSAVLQGIVVGTSGVQPWYDEWISYMVAAACRSLCIEAMQEKLLTDKERNFLWERQRDGVLVGNR